MSAPDLKLSEVTNAAEWAQPCPLVSAPRPKTQVQVYFWPGRQPVGVQRPARPFELRYITTCPPSFHPFHFGGSPCSTRPQWLYCQHRNADAQARPGTLGAWHLNPEAVTLSLRLWGGVWNLVAPGSSEPVSHSPSRSLEFLFSDSFNMCEPRSRVLESGCSPSFYSQER